LELLLPDILRAAITIIGLSALGALIGLDYIAFGQTMLAQPVVAGVIVGFAAGELVLGMWAGLAFQFLWAGKLPIGQYVPPNSCNAAVFAVIAAAALPETIPVAMRVVGAGLFAVPVGIIGGRRDISVKKGNDKIVARAENAIADGDFVEINRAIAAGLFRFLRKDFVLLIIASTIGILLLWPSLLFFREYVASGAELAFRVLPAVGIGAALRGFDSRRNRFGYIIGLVIGVIAIIAVNRDIISTFIAG